MNPQLHSKCWSFYPQISVVLILHQGTLLATDGDHYRKPQPTKYRVVEPSPQGEICNRTPTPRAQGSLGKRERLQKLEELAVRLSPRNVRSYTHKTSPTWLPKHELSKDSNRYGNVDREEPWCPNPRENYRQPRTAESWRNNLPQGRAQQLVSSTKSQP